MFVSVFNLFLYIQPPEEKKKKKEEIDKSKKEFIPILFWFRYGWLRMEEVRGNTEANTEERTSGELVPIQEAIRRVREEADKKKETKKGGSKGVAVTGESAQGPKVMLPKPVIDYQWEKKRNKDARMNSQDAQNGQQSSQVSSRAGRL